MASVFENSDKVVRQLRAGPTTAKFFFEQGTHFARARELSEAFADVRGDLCVHIWVHGVLACLGWE